MTYLAKMKKIGGLVLLTMGLGGLTLLSVSPAYAQGVVPFQTLDQGENSGIEVERDTVLLINTDEQLESFYAAHNGLSAPDIDMSEVSVIAAIASPRRSSGYNLEITDLLQREDLPAQLRVAETGPGSDCLDLQRTVPYHVIITYYKVTELV